MTATTVVWVTRGALVALPSGQILTVRLSAGFSGQFVRKVPPFTLASKMISESDQ